MIGRRSSILAIAVADGSFACAEVAARGDRRVRRAAVFAWPAGLTLGKPEPLGLALRAFLKAEGFGNHPVAVGLPARWVLAQERELPPASASEALDALRLQAEQLTASDSAEMCFDFVGRLEAGRPNRVLMIGTLRKRVEQIEAVLTAAGLRLRAVTPTVLTLPPVAGEDDGLVMLIGGGGAELVWQRAGAPRAIQHVPLSMNGHGRSMALLGTEVRRAGVLPAGSGRAAEASVLDAVGLTPHELARLSESLGEGVTLRPTPAGGGGGEGVDPKVTPAVAVGLAAADARLLVDFRHSRLEPVERMRIGRATWWAAAIALLLIVVVALEVLAYRGDTAELAALEEALARQAPDVEAAEATIARTGFGRGFYDGRPAALAYLAELTGAFGERDAVWATGVSFRQDGRGQLVGAGADQPSVLALLDRLKASGAFTDVTLVDLRESTTTREREVSFTMTLTFRPEAAPAAPAAPGVGEAGR